MNFICQPDLRTSSGMQNCRLEHYILSVLAAALNPECMLANCPYLCIVAIKAKGPPHLPKKKQAKRPDYQLSIHLHNPRLQKGCGSCHSPAFGDGVRETQQKSLTFRHLTHTQSQGWCVEDKQGEGSQLRRGRVITYAGCRNSDGGFSFLLCYNNNNNIFLVHCNLSAFKIAKQDISSGHHLISKAPPLIWLVLHHLKFINKREAALGLLVLW